MESGSTRKYFAQRAGRGPVAKPLSFDAIALLLINEIDSFRARDYFQQAFGYECVDAGLVTGSTGANPSAHFLKTIGRSAIWPYWEPEPGEYYAGFETPPARWQNWDRDTLFDVVEVLHDLVSKPVEGRAHTFNNCGVHYHTFDRAEGRVEFRHAMNDILARGEPGLRFNDAGELVELAPEAFRPLLAAPIPSGADHDLVDEKIEAAKRRFEARGSDNEEKRIAVRDLVDVMEVIRPDVKESFLSKDEAALYNLANNFSIRHNSRAQRGDFDQDTWLRWMFYVYLATIHATLRLRKRHD